MHPPGRMGFIFIYKCPAKQPVKFSLFRNSNSFSASLSSVFTALTHPWNQSSKSRWLHLQRAQAGAGPPNPAGTAAVTGKDKAVLQSPLIPQQLPKQGLTKPCTPPPCPQTQPCPAARPDWARPANPRCKLFCLGPQLN